MTMTIELSDDQVSALQKLAAKLGVDPNELARCAVQNFLNQYVEFERAADKVLTKNRELYQRFA